jgi:signal transduction histidine kinase
MNSDAVFELPGVEWPMLLVNAAGGILLANPAAVEIFGGSLQSGTTPLAKILPPKGAPDVEQLISDAGKIQPARTLKFRAEDGATRTFSVSVCPFKTGTDNYFIFQLFPEAAEARKPPVETKHAQKQKLDCALRLARTVSLDFNNALTSILGHTSLLLSKAEPQHPWRRSLLEVEKSAARAAEIASELAVFSQQEMATRPQPPGNLNAATRRCVEFFRNTHSGKITWKLQLERELFGALFEEANIQQALTKILENAVEAVDGARGRIVVQTRNVVLTEPTQDRNVQLAAGTYVSVEITDNGGGISAEVLPRIFEPFFTTKKPPHRGLGLALVYGIVANHGGGVAVSSQPGAGTSARIYLPAEKQIVPECVGTADDFHGSETVLVVDDESVLLTMSEMILTDYGYRVLTAGSGQQALAILSREDTKVDLVLTDLVMPGMGGRELVERIRLLAPETRILCMSGYSLLEDKQNSSTHLRKPFASADLLAKVRQALISEPSVD